jgi:hypothetical protein
MIHSTARSVHVKLTLLEQGVLAVPSLRIMKVGLAECSGLDIAGSPEQPEGFGDDPPDGSGATVICTDFEQVIGASLP